MATAAPPLDVADFERYRGRILAELQQRSAMLRAAGGDRIPAILIRRMFDELFGAAHGPEERRRFFVFVAPIFRRLALARLASVEIGTIARIDVIELEQWLSRLQGFDALCVQMIDLHYFVGLSTRHTAEMLGVGPKAVIRDLRFAKAWLRARSRWLHQPTE